MQTFKKPCMVLEGEHRGCMYCGQEAPQPRQEGKIPLTLYSKEEGMRPVTTCSFLHCIFSKVHSQIAQATPKGSKKVPPSAPRTKKAAQHVSSFKYLDCRGARWLSLGQRQVQFEAEGASYGGHHSSPVSCYQTLLDTNPAHIGKEHLSPHIPKHMTRQLWIETPRKGKGKARGLQWCDGQTSRWAFAIQMPPEEEPVLVSPVKRSSCCLTDYKGVLMDIASVS